MDNNREHKEKKDEYDNGGNGEGGPENGKFDGDRFGFFGSGFPFPGFPFGNMSDEQRKEFNKFMNDLIKKMNELISEKFSHIRTPEDLEKMDWNEFFEEMVKRGLVPPNIFPPGFPASKMFGDMMKSIGGLQGKEGKIGGPLFFGFNIKIGPDGVNITPVGGNPPGFPPEKTVEPPPEPPHRDILTDVLEDDDYVIVVAEMPGVTKENIKMRATPDTLYVTADDEEGNRKYDFEVKLPVPVKTDKAKASYKNGILEVRLEKRNKGTRK